MRKLVVIDLTSANIELFESYERKVLPLLKKYKAELEICVRSIDGDSETHILYFPDISYFERFLSDPIRLALQDDWKRTGVKTTVLDVEQVGYL